MHPILVAAFQLSTFSHPLAGCDTATTTRSAETCMEQQSRARDDTLRRLAAVVRSRLDKATARSFDSAAVTWNAYRTQACKSVYSFWREGSIRNVQYMSCVLDLTDERINHLASTYFPPNGLRRDSIAIVFTKNGPRR